MSKTQNKNTPGVLYYGVANVYDSVYNGKKYIVYTLDSKYICNRCPVEPSINRHAFTRLQDAETYHNVIQKEIDEKKAIPAVAKLHEINKKEIEDFYNTIFEFHMGIER